MNSTTMKRRFLFTFVVLSVSYFCLSAQSYRNDSGLWLEKIMMGEEWTGFAPENERWSEDGKYVFFEWNPDKELSKSLYRYSINSQETGKLNARDKKGLLPSYGSEYNSDKTRLLFTKDGALYLYDLKEFKKQRLLQLSQNISSPQFSADEESVYFICDNNFHKFCLKTGTIQVLTRFISGMPSGKTAKSGNEQEEWLKADQIELFDILKKEKRSNEMAQKERDSLQPEKPMEIYSGKSRVYGHSISGDENFLLFLKFERNSDGKQTEMPQYVTESGFTENRKLRSKVGYPYGKMEMGIFNIGKDTVYNVNTDSLPGIFDHYVFEEQQRTETRENKRDVYISGPYWNPSHSLAAINLRSVDNKDRWICLVNPEDGNLQLIDHQNDEAWIGGPGIGWSTSGGTLGWIDDKRLYFQSEESGYSHLYVWDSTEGKTAAITKGEYEVYDPVLSNDREYFWFHSNEVHPGERHFYRIGVDGKKKTRLTYMKGRNDVSLSPDQKTMLIRHSYANKPWELYISAVDLRKPEDQQCKQITDSYGKDFKSYNWRVPEFIRFTTTDGVSVPARLYRPAKSNKNNAAVIFVHGAGYLQNAHKWWSSYYREYMFHNFLADNGYTVLDIDYRASAGYGRDWRTAIYRHMGGKDLQDNVEGANYLVVNEDIDPGRIGIYGGSYGGFITLMAMFTRPGTFRAGAALRSVTDWAHYNHGYTSNILNTPVSDSLAYRRSSPIYFAEGLEGHLVMCHGMEDDNVHFQDIVRLSQRLIELQKDNWELAVYPVEPHGFKESSSWLDEYKRIYKIFEENLLEE